MPNPVTVLLWLLQQVEQHHHNAQYHKDHAGGPVQRFGRCLVGEHSGDPRPDQREHHAQDENRPVRRTADGKVGDRPYLSILQAWSDSQA